MAQLTELAPAEAPAAPATSTPLPDLVLILSVIKTPKLPLSYTWKRSSFSHEGRWKQTKVTFGSIKKHLPNAKVMMVECSDLDKDLLKVINENVDYFINKIDDIPHKDIIYDKWKAHGEATQTLTAFKYIKEHNLQFKNIFKISGRYYLTDDFKYDLYDNDLQVFKVVKGYDPIPDQHKLGSISTRLYKIPHSFIDQLGTFLENYRGAMQRRGTMSTYEKVFAQYLLESNYENIVLVKDPDKIGIEGKVSVRNNNLINE